MGDTRDCNYCLGTGKIPDLRLGNRGNGSWRARLEPSQIRGIYESQENVRLVCMKYGISNSTYYSIRERKEWDEGL